MIVHPHGNVIFCDDIRHEITGKLILIGVYQNDLLFGGTPPWTLNGLWCQIRYSEAAPDEPLPPLKLIVSRRDEGGEPQEIASVSLPEIDPASLPKIEADASNDLARDGLRLFNTGATIGLGPMQFERMSRIRVTMKRGDDDIFLGSLIVGPVPSQDLE